MPQDEAQFDFARFKTRVRFIGEEDGPAYETVIEAPGFEPAYSGVVLKGLPLFSSAARAAVLQFRTLLAEGVKAFLDDYRENSGITSLKETQNMRLTFLSWHDLATSIGDEALAAAEAELRAEEARESKETYGKEQEEPLAELPPPDVVYDLGSLMMSVRQMGMIENFPFWGVTATATGTDLHANSIIGVQSPLPSHAAQGMVENLKSVLNLGVERYLIEEERQKHSPAKREKKSATEMLHAVASKVGTDGLAIAEQRVQEEVDREKTAFADQAIAQMEAEVAVRKERLKKR